MIESKSCKGVGSRNTGGSAVTNKSRASGPSDVTSDGQGMWLQIQEGTTSSLVPGCSHIYEPSLATNQLSLPV